MTENELRSIAARTPDPMGEDPDYVLLSVAERDRLVAIVRGVREFLVPGRGGLDEVIYRSITAAAQNQPEHGLVGEHGTHNLLTRYVTEAVTAQLRKLVEET